MSNSNFKYKTEASSESCLPESSNLSFVSQLESLFSRYGPGIYTLCLRLTADEKAAESATVGVFVKFSREMASCTDESRIRLRLAALAITESLARLHCRTGLKLRRFSRSLRLKLRELRRY